MVDSLRTTVSLLLLLVTGVNAQEQQPRLATASDPFTAIFDAFRSHSLVALGEPHGNEQAHAFSVALIRDPRFAEAVDDIVVEFGNSKYQDAIDRFVNGANVPETILRDVWRNTTVANFVWDRPIYEEFFRAVRAVNLARSKRHIRVLLGDPAIDWSSVRTPDDLLARIIHQ